MNNNTKMYNGRTRNEVIIRGGRIAVLVQMLLAIIKIAVGLVTNSIAFITDAIDNAIEAVMAAVLIIGTKLSGKHPDKKHPLGYGRVEYLANLVIAILVIYVACTVIIESAEKVMHPEDPHYTMRAIVIIAITVVVKFLFGIYAKKHADMVQSHGYKEIADEALRGTVTSAVTIVIAIIFVQTGLSLEAYFGIFAGLLVLRSGVMLIRNMSSEMIGERAQMSLVNEIKKTVRSVDGVNGAYDLVLHRYGHENVRGSVHIEVDEDMTAAGIDIVTREICRRVKDELGVEIEAVSVYAANPKDPEAVEIKKRISRMAHENRHVRAMHGFFMDESRKYMSFDLVIGFETDDRAGEYQKVVERIQQEFPDYELDVALDTDTSDWT